MSSSAGSLVSIVNPVPETLRMRQAIKLSELAVTTGAVANVPDPNDTVADVPVSTTTAYPAWLLLIMSEPDTVRSPPICTSPRISAIPSIVILPSTIIEFLTRRLLRLSIEPEETRPERSNSFPSIINIPSMVSGP